MPEKLLAFVTVTHYFNLPDAGVLKLNIVKKILLANSSRV